MGTYAYAHLDAATPAVQGITDESFEAIPTVEAQSIGLCEEQCVICMSEPRDTAVLPCRHMCMCADCAKALREQTNKCPICRRQVESLLKIVVARTDKK